MATLSYCISNAVPAPPRRRIAVFGALGATGQHAVRQALAAGYRVTACTSNPARLPFSHPALNAVQADPMHEESLSGLLDGHDAVLCLLGHRPEGFDPARAATPGMALSARSTRQILVAMAHAKVRRIVVLGAAGVAESLRTSRFGAGWWMRHAWPDMIADRERQEALLRRSLAHWTVLRPVRFNRRPATGAVRCGEDLRWGWGSVSREDVAAAMVQLVDDPQAAGKALIVT